MRGLIALGGAALAVIAGVFGLALVVLPSAPTPTVAAAPDVAAPGPDASETTPPAVPTPGPLAAIGGEIAVTGDLEFTMPVNPAATGFQQGDGPYRIADGNKTWLMVEYEDGNPVIGQASIDGRNFFLDPDECPFEIVETSEPLGLARFSLSCQDVSDIQDATTVSLEGYADVALLAAGLDYPAGGTLTFTADETAEWVFEDAYWVTYPETMSEDQLYVDTCTRENYTDCVGLTFASTQGKLEVESVVPRDATYTSSTGCTVGVTELHPLGPDTDYVEIALDCTDLVDEDGNPATLTGTLRAYRVKVYFR